MFITKRFKESLHFHPQWKWLVWVQIFLQFLVPCLTALPSSADQKDLYIKETTPISEDLNQLATTLSANDYQQSLAQAKGNLFSSATSSTASSVESWLNQFGKAQVRLNVDNEGHWDNSSMDLLVPLYEDKKALLFSQLGLRAPDSRVTTNTGMGVRTFYLKDWMLGANVFYDDDITGKNKRVGFGGEAWTNYLKFSANSYLGTSEWHSARDFDNYNEKPADGFDVRIEGYFPAQPQLGAKVIYEKYHGDRVALFDTDNLQKNPSAVTMGVSYTPIPLISFATNYRRGQDDMSDTQFEIDVTYDFSRDWRYQLSPDNVAFQRSLAGSRYDLVERNNQIILQYKKKETQGVSKLVLQTLTDNSPADGLAQNTLQVQALNDKGEVVTGAPILWTSTGTAKLDATASSTDKQGNANVNVSDTQNEVVSITASSAGVSTSASTRFDVVTASNLTLVVDKNDSVADGVATNDATATVTDINNRPISNAKLNWKVNAPAIAGPVQLTTDAEGVAHVKVTSTQAGRTLLSVGTGTLSQQQSLNFTANNQLAVITSFEVTHNQSPANGTALDSALVVVRDPQGNPVCNEPVTMSADKKTVSFSAPAKLRSVALMQTDSNGQLQVNFTDTVAEDVQLTAALTNGNNKNVSAQFVADSTTQALQDLTLSIDNSLANGSNANQAVVYVRDKNNNPLNNIKVNWATDKSSVKIASQTTTNSEGMTTVAFTSAVAQIIQLTASLGNGNHLSVESHFIADVNNATLQNLKVVNNGRVANGTDADMAQVYVLDKNGNPLENQLVSWSVDKQGVTLPAQSQTDGSGMAIVSYTSTVAQSFTLTASLRNGAQASVPSLFIADIQSVQIKTFNVTSGAVANGRSPNTASVEIVDANNNPVQDATVSWSVTGSAQPSAHEGKTDAQGKLAITLSDTKAESVSLTVSLQNGASQTKPCEFIADVTTAKISDLTATSLAVANGSAKNSSTVTVVDANNNPLPKASVNWVTNGDAVLQQNTSETDNAGHSTVTFTDLHAQTVTVTASITGGESKDVTSVFVADSDNALISSLIISPNGSPADGKTANRAQIVVLDTNNNPVEGAKIAWTSDSVTVPTPSPGTTDSDGKASVDFTDTVAQKVALTATLSNGKNKSVASLFVADVTTAKVVLSMDSNNKPADGTTADVILAVVTDGQGNVLANQNINWRSTSTTAVIAPSSTTDMDGNSRVNITDSIGEDVAVTAVLANSQTNTVTATFISHQVDTLTVNATTQNADGHSSLTFTAKVVDSLGKPVANSPVTFSTTIGHSILSASDASTDPSGNVQVTLTDTFAENVIVTAKSTDNAQDNGKTQAVTFTQEQITKIFVNGQTFDANVGFPSTGFSSASFQLLVAGDAVNNSGYTWTSDQNAWIRVDATGLVKLAGDATSTTKTVTITATPTAGGQPLTYSFTIKHWIINIARSGNSTEANDDCASNNATVPSYTILSNGQPGSRGTRAIGTLWGEWGDPSNFTWSTSSPAESMWASETGNNGTNIYVHWRDGYVNQNTPTQNMDEVCLQEL